ncbi:MAG: hypothetical protein M3O62_08905 [Pseudomonadota bacterium]|nr:hypothetical protein [Pseudomonadota bacterium]
MSTHTASARSRCTAIPHLLFAALMLTLSAPLHASGSPRGDEDGAFSLGPNALHSTRYIAQRGIRDSLQITANFLGADNSPLQLSFTLPRRALRDSQREHGIVKAELDAVIARCQRETGCSQREFERRILAYYRDHGLRPGYDEQQRQRLLVDVPTAVRRNRERIRPLTQALQRLAAEQQRDPQWMLETAVALVQSGLDYKQPSTWDRGRKIVGFYPPPQALERGYGDCDTKSALLAAILQNLGDTPLIGVHVPQHYLLGIAGTPRAGQASIQHGGRSYLLIEAAGPARRPPGEVSEVTESALAKGVDIRIDPII